MDPDSPGLTIHAVFRAQL